MFTTACIQCSGTYSASPARRITSFAVAFSRFGNCFATSGSVQSAEVCRAGTQGSGFRHHTPNRWAVKVKPPKDGGGHICVRMRRNVLLLLSTALRLSVQQQRNRVTPTKTQPSERRPASSCYALLGAFGVEHPCFPRTRRGGSCALNRSRLLNTSRRNHRARMRTMKLPSDTQKIDFLGHRRLRPAFPQTSTMMEWDALFSVYGGVHSAL